MRKALVLSVGVHAVIFGVARPIALRTAAAEPALVEPTDRWTGTTADLPGAGPTGELFDVSLDPPAHAATEPAIPSPPAPPAPPAPAAAEPAPPAPPPPSRAPQAVEPPAPKAPDAVPPPPPTPRPRRPAPVASADTAPSAAAAESAPPPGRRSKRAAAEPGAEGPSPPPGGSARGPGGAAGSFGSEGTASVRDLRVAFKRAIPAACQSDGIWAQIPLGATDKMEVEIEVDDTGHITRAEPRTSAHSPNAPPQALLHVLRRTIPLLEAGTFAVKKGKVGAGTEVIELRATVTEVANATDTLSNDDPRTASFTQPTGRHVEVSVTVLRVDLR